MRFELVKRTFGVLLYHRKVLDFENNFGTIHLSGD